MAFVRNLVEVLDDIDTAAQERGFAPQFWATLVAFVETADPDRWLSH
jgi:hypothetical protein